MLKILERAWLIIATGVGCMAIYKFFIAETKEAMFLTVFCGVAVLMYIIRRKQRIKFDANRAAADQKYH